MIHLRRAGNIQFFKLPKILRTAVALAPFYLLLSLFILGRAKRLKGGKLESRLKMSTTRNAQRVLDFGFGGIIINKKRENG